jgi:hypothetical protein
MSQKEIGQDLSMLFADRLHNQIMDAITRGEIAEVPQQDTIDMVMGFLLAELICGAWSCNIGEEKFLKVCQEAYRETHKTLEAVSKRKRQRQH